MRKWSSLVLQCLARLFPFPRLPLGLLLSLQGLLGLIDLAFKVGDTSLCKRHGFDGFDRGKFIKAHAHIYAEAVSIPQRA